MVVVRWQLEMKSSEGSEMTVTYMSGVSVLLSVVSRDSSLASLHGNIESRGKKPKVTIHLTIRSRTRSASP